MNRMSRAILALLFAACTAGCESLPIGDDAGWITLLDGERGLENWNLVGDANWRPLDGAIQADRKPGKAGSFIVTKSAYKDFRTRIEFWASHDANSGIYLRCADAAQITDKTCYEANIFDQRPDPTYGTGAIVHLAPVKPMPKAGGQWNVYDITLKGDRITVLLNGNKTVELQDGRFAGGPLALQYASGMVRFRKVQVRPL
jgi:hypothetical protein